MQIGTRAVGRGRWRRIALGVVGASIVTVAATLPADASTRPTAATAHCPAVRDGITGTKIEAEQSPATVSVRDTSTGAVTAVTVTITGTSLAVTAPQGTHLTNATWCLKASTSVRQGNGTTGTSTVTNKRGVAQDISYVVLYRVATPIRATIGAGSSHTCAVRTGGTVWCWGWNRFGQLGDGTTTDSATPVQVLDVAGAVAVTAGSGHTCALLADRTVRCWGGNNLGQLGNGTFDTPQPSPLEVVGVDSAVAIEAGGLFTCALLADGTLSCWGNGGGGVLGSPGSSPLARPVPFVSGATAIGAGSFHVCVALTDGTARCWGSNLFGQLGNGITGVSSTTAPVTPTGLTGVTALSAGLESTCALRADGTARCWGRNDVGQLGNGTTTGSAVPVAVNGLAGAVAIDTGTDSAQQRDHTCALLGGGTVRCWGRNGAAQLGDGTTTDRSSPVAVSGLVGATAVASGALHSCALTAGGATCWGANTLSQLGNPGAGGGSLVPVPVLGLP